jgi:hypothetical protein
MTHANTDEFDEINIVEATKTTSDDQNHDLNASRKIDRSLKINYACVCFYAFLTGN